MALICSFGLLDTRKLFWVSLAEIGKTQLAPMAKVNEVMLDDLIWEAASSTQNAQIFEATNPLGTWALSVKEDEAERIVIALTCRLNKEWPPVDVRIENCESGIKDGGPGIVRKETKAPLIGERRPFNNGLRELRFEEIRKQEKGYRYAAKNFSTSTE